MIYDYSNVNRNRFLYEESNIAIKAEQWNKNDNKEILQYAVGGLLYMPASNSKIADKIISREYDFIKSMVLDLEDSLGDDLVGFGQRTIRDTIQKIKEAINKGKLTVDDIPLIFIRVRDHNQMIKTVDMLGDNISIITGFNIPKFSKLNCKSYVQEFKEVVEKCRGINNNMFIMPIIEDKETMYRQLRMENLLTINDCIRDIQDRVLNIRIGGVDFCSVFGIRRSMQDDIYDIGVVRSVINDIINVFGKSYVVSGPAWEYFENSNNINDKRWSDGLKHEIYADKLNGMLGKTVIHPSQLPIVQQSLIVKLEDYNDAISIIGMNTNTVGVKKNVSGNRMNEVKTHINWAKKTLGLARVYGVKDDRQ